MNRINYIQKEIESSDSGMTDYPFLYPLILSLDPNEAVKMLDLDFNQDFIIRRYLLKKIGFDISESLLECHVDLIDNLLELSLDGKFRKKESCNFSINYLYDYLPDWKQDEILRIFIGSKYIRNRKRAFKRLINDWDNSYYDLVSNTWNIYKDIECFKLIIAHFPADFLIENYEELIPHLNSFIYSKFFLKIATINNEKIHDLRDIDSISYAYVMVKLHQKLSLEDAFNILGNNISDDRIGLLLWCFGKMKLWDVIIKYKNMSANTSQ
ncbi:MAG TPA: hypothetical protein DEO54_09505 [Rikenellaceae bacterium]|nr:MAG: hypothetical protein A2X20_08860 [Bacteroidetes bacterium GWE2_40_15]HBZ26449.1 hypothetical protein [Rikenellaceae bacterium]